jgi:hypothetical protein
MPLELSLRRADLHSLETPLLVVPLASDWKPNGPLERLDKALGGALSRFHERREFRGSRDETLHLAGVAKGPARILLIGIGSPSDRNGALKRAAAIGARQGHKMGVGSLAWHSPDGSAAAV